MRLKRHLPIWIIAVFGFVFIAGAVEHVIGFQRQPTNSDEALSVLMGREFLRGHFPMFLWGQNFGGALEAIPVGIIDALFGHSLVAGRSMTILWSIAGCVLLWRVALRYTTRVGALVASLIIWVWPVFFVEWTMHEYLYYVPTVALGLAAWLMAQKLFEDGNKWVYSGGAGAVLGIAWWLNPAVIIYFVPVAVLLLLTKLHRLRNIGVAVVAFLVTDSPWIIFNLRHHFTSLDTHQLASGATYSERLANYFHGGLAVSLGLRDEQGIAQVDHLTRLLSVLALIGFAIGFYLIARYAWINYRRHEKVAPPVDTLALVLYPLAYALSKAVGNAATFTPRYAYFGWPLLALLVGRIVSYRKLPAAVPVALSVLLTVGGLAAASQQKNPAFPYGAVKPAHYDYNELAKVLRQKQQTALFTGYWQAYLLDVAGDGQITATAPSYVRYKPYDKTVRADNHPVWLFFEQSNKLKAMHQWLNDNKINYADEQVDGFVVVNPARKVLPEDVPYGVKIDPNEGG